MGKLLIVEDDKTIAMGIEYSLRQEGFEPVVCYNAQTARNALEAETYQLVLLDVALPDGSGYELCKLIRAKGETPVIFLTACDDEVNVVMGLDLGADDYVTKPFRVRELLSRIRSVLRRYRTLPASARTELRLGPVAVNTAEASVSKHGKPLTLTALEYKLLLIFASHQGQLLTRSQILEGIWDAAGEFVNDNTLTVYIKRLREKIEDDPQQPRLIQTVRGLGYKTGGSADAE